MWAYEVQWHYLLESSLHIELNKAKIISENLELNNDWKCKITIYAEVYTIILKIFLYNDTILQDLV